MFKCIRFSYIAFSIDFLQLQEDVDKNSMSQLEVIKTHAYESKRKFKVSWVAKLLWVGLQVGSNSYVHIVKCKIFFLSIKIYY